MAAMRETVRGIKPEKTAFIMGGGSLELRILIKKNVARENLTLKLYRQQLKLIKF